MLLAVPAIMLIAASRLAAFKSGILSSAIFCTSALLMVATLVLLGVAEADFKLQAFFSRTAAGGVLVTKLKLLSAYTVITTGMIRSPWSAVLALNSLGRSYWRSRCCLSSRNLQFDISCYFLCHLRHLLKLCGIVGNLPPTSRRN